MLHARNKKIVIDERRQGSPGEKLENQMNKYKRVTNNTPGKKTQPTTSTRKHAAMTGVEKQAFEKMQSLISAGKMQKPMTQVDKQTQLPFSTCTTKRIKNHPLHF